MTAFDFNKCYLDQAEMAVFDAIDGGAASKFGRQVRAVELSNAEYDRRYRRMAQSRNMKAPPSHLRIFPGYLVVRRLDCPDQYETWMPEGAFNECYRPS
ncbi:hypothetical protein RD110_08080 [Rhodoferax koreense]|uniref:Uncharacterized protein n=1 Tax=Rhodoferax koreensis TaxID=1842727 RepID=A0A1P8JTZ2_9BURK|nr:hypothetical protein RD110_08080 [Rhodoferax koreense]